MPTQKPSLHDHEPSPRQLPSRLTAVSTLATRALFTPLPAWAAADARKLAATVASVDLDVHDDDELAVQLFREAGREHRGASRSLRHALTGAALRLLRDHHVPVRMRIVGGHPYSAMPGHHSRWQPRGIDGRFHRTDALPPAPFIDDAVGAHLIAWEHTHDHDFGRSAA